MGLKANVRPVQRICGVVQATHAFLDGYGDGYVNTSDATAEAMDIAMGKSAYSGGEKIQGRVPAYDFTVMKAEQVTDSEDSVTLEYREDHRIMLNQNAKVSVYAPLTDFGDATAADVAKGKSFTSKSGLRVIGLSESNGGIATGDATAEASDIARGKTAYVDGNKVVGTVPFVDFSLMDATSFGGSSQYISMMLKHTERIIYNKDATLSVSAPSSGFGDALASDVAEGKTFTSVCGFKVTGTAKIGGITAQGYGDTIIIITSAQVSSYGDDIIIGG